MTRQGKTPLEMPTPVWKRVTNKSVSLSQAKKFFAVDASGSTEGDVMRAESEFVRGLHSNPNDNVTKWAGQCERPQLVDNTGLNYFTRKRQWTCAEATMKEPSAVAEIWSSDIWCFLTDGEITSGCVTSLTKLAVAQELLYIPLVLLVVGGKQPTPEESNIPVVLPFFKHATVGVFLFKDSFTGELYVIAAKGSLTPLASSTDDDSMVDLSSWKSYPCYANEAELMRRCEELGLRVVSSECRPAEEEVSLCSIENSGTHTLVKVNQLLAQYRIGLSDLTQLLEKEAFARVISFCKARNRLADLRAFLINLRQEKITVRLEDLNGASKILEAMRSTKLTSDERGKLGDQLREAHGENRTTCLRLEKHRNESHQEKRTINRLIHYGIAILSDIERSGYSPEILLRKSNRARRAERVSPADVHQLLSALRSTVSVNAFRDHCSICCGNDQIMSIVLKKLEAPEENTTDFALNFPLAAAQAEQNMGMISSQCICFQCALNCKKESIFKETLSAIIPTMDYSGSNESYMNHQLTLAITAGLSTGISGITQVFMTILDRTLETKDWCSDQSGLKDGQKDSETSIRRNTLKWMLSNLLYNCRCRENFNEASQFTCYPQVMKWATEDFERRGLDSWVIQYPLAGFCQIMRWLDILELEVSSGLSDMMLKTKLIHAVVTIMMARLLDDKAKDRAWKNPFLQLIYHQFNVPGIPLDMGSASIVEAGLFWSRLEAALGQFSDVKRFLALFPSSTRLEVVQHVQLVVFWVLHKQKGHTSPKTFFRNILLQEPLAPAALVPTTSLPDFAVRGVLLSIFCEPKTTYNLCHRPDFNVPFVSPYGPSVLECGESSCPIKFYSEGDPSSLQPDAVRKRRREHLKEIYGTSREFNASPSGLPEPTQTSALPTSNHYNLHRSIARVWSRLNRTANSGPPLAPSFAHDPAAPFVLPSKEEILTGNAKALTEFVAEVRFEICTRNRRGNIYQDLETNIRQVLPSFWRALRVASKKSGLEEDGDDDGSGVAFVHDWTHGSNLGAKIEYELSLRE